MLILIKNLQKPLKVLKIINITLFALKIQQKTLE